MWDLFLLALALVLVIEGIFPFINPNGYRGILQKIAQMNDKSIRSMGLGMMTVGALTVYFLK